MKCVRFSSLFLFSLVFIPLFFSCLGDKENSLPPELQSRIDSLSVFYSLSKEDSLSDDEKHKAVNQFIEGAAQFNIDSLILKGYSRKASLYNDEDKWDLAIQASHVLLEKAQLKSDSNYIGTAYFKIGLYNKKKKEWTKAFENYNRSFKIHRNIGDSLKAGKRCMAMANIQKRMGDYGGSLQTAIDGLEFNDKTDDYRTISGLYHIISVCYKEQKKDSNALKWNEKVLDLIKDSIAFKKVGMNEVLTFLNTKANIYEQRGEFDKSIALLDSLRNTPEVIKDSTEYARVTNNLGYVLWKKDSTNNQSLNLILEALDIRQKRNEDLISSNIKLTEYFSQINPEQALKHATIAFGFAKGLKNPMAQIEALECIEKIEGLDLESSKRLNNLYREISDARNKLREIYAPTRYENELLTKNIQEEKLESSNQRNLKNIFLFIGLIALASTLFIYFFLKQRGRQRAELAKIQERHKTENRLTKKVHDEVGNDLYYLMTQIQHNPDFLEKKGYKVLDGLQSIYSKARDISREYSAVDTGENYPDELLSLLNSYGNTKTNIVTTPQKPEFWANIKAQTKEGVFRLVQELLTNMKKHSEATLVAVTFFKEPKTLIINYSDNGKGTEVAQPKLRSAETRVKELGGRLNLGSDLQQGFTLKIEIPI
ncbi:hypothetical protein POV27_01615 [Aureisphaera galaxeae]|uniref:tetratricopeptide repeat-containing sensor histidine kinase n=1 Tax=Aureisphaera galaxeae TaxID=1538023 RepID=UPI00235068FE|nr:hypothetical protein [Aureisphaera galaxeae]MDC8002737.1 hypothetical protein [Aureisphaera galaxeae]